MANGHFILTGGPWRQVEENFYQSVTDFVADQVREEACEPLHAGVSMANQTAHKNHEAVFNTQACLLRPQSIRFDQAKLWIGLSRQDKESCDILDLTDDGTMRIINCEPYKDLHRSAICLPRPASTATSSSMIRCSYRKS